MKTSLINLYCFLSFFLLSGCLQKKMPLPDSIADSTQKVSVHFQFQCSRTSTRSVLQGNIENKITEICLWAYDETGQLETAEYARQDGTVPLELYLSMNKRYHIYALVNMGEAKAPEKWEDAIQFQYKIPSYHEIARKGIPMSGLLENFKVKQKNAIISITRLLAKVSLTMTAGEINPDEITSVKICNYNTVLKPFSSYGSCALSPQDIANGEEKDAICRPGWEGNKYTFYIPENRQGRLLPDNKEQSQKTPESLKANGLSEKIPLCTYIETLVQFKDATIHHGMSGTMKYRFFLGGDNTSDFDIVRNEHYKINFSLTWNGQFYDENWRVDNSQMTDNRVIEMNGLLGYVIVADGLRIKRGNNIKIAPGCTGGVAIKFKIKGQNLAETTPCPGYDNTYNSESNLFTLQHFGVPEGWTISEDTQAQLRQHGITWCVKQAALRHDENQSQPQHFDKENLIYFGNEVPTTWDSNIISEHFHIYLMLTIPPQTEEGLIIPIKVCSPDLSVSQTMTLYISSDNLIYHISDNCPTTGTCPTLEVSSNGNSLSDIHIELDKNCRDLLDLIPSRSGQYKLRLKKKGEAIINATACCNGQRVSCPDLRFNIENPIISTSTAQVEVSQRGDPFHIHWVYRKKMRNKEIKVATSEENADENSFSPSLYDQYLKPEITILDNITFEYEGQQIQCSKQNLDLAVSQNDVTIRLKKPYRQGELTSMLEISSPDSTIRPYHLPIYLSPLFRDFNANTMFSRICFCISDRPIRLHSGFGITPSRDERKIIDPRQFIYNEKKYKVDILHHAAHFDVYLNTDMQLTIHYHPFPSSYTAGKIDLTARISDLQTGEKLTEQPIGYVYSYLYTQMGNIAMKNANSEAVSVCTILLNPERTKAFQNLEQIMEKQSNLIQTHFEDQSIWTHMKGYTDSYACIQIDENGQERIPNRCDDNEYLVRWENMFPSGTINRPVYKMFPGKGFDTTFLNWHLFSKRFQPICQFDMTRIQNLYPYSDKKDIYFFNYENDSNRDSKGNPFYFIAVQPENTWMCDCFL